MKQKKIKKFSILKWFLWLALVVAWNFCYPSATPIEDVLVTVTLAIFMNLIKPK